MSLMLSLAVLPESALYAEQAQAIAQHLQLELLPPGQNPRQMDPGHALVCVGENGVVVQESGKKAPGPVLADFVGGAVGHRRQFGGGAGQQIAKAVGIKSGIRPRVADLTAGLGRDAFVLASLGCEVTLVERQPLVALLLADGLARAQLDSSVAPIVARMTLETEHARTWLQHRLEWDESRRPEVIYLDPMFPHSRKSAEVKKEMRLFRDLVGADSDADALLPLALQVAVARVVVKRPRKAPVLNEQAPGYSLEGKSGRFDIYPLRTLGRSSDG